MRASLLLLLAVGCDNIKPPAPVDTDEGQDTAPPGACLELSVESVDFGSVGVGELLTTTVTASNPCSEVLTVSSITIDAPFQASPGYLELAPGEFSTMTVFVQPTGYGAFASDLTLTTDNAELGTNGVVTIPVTALTIDDVDGDGYATTAAGGDDCDDDDASVNPDADEVWYDGIDQNCDGGNDYDQDGDGWDASTDDHEVDDSEIDCNDANVDYYPGAPDAPYDNRDTNCDDSNDWDYDDDGYESLAYGRGSDCDDFDPSVNREGSESLNGKDDNCDGLTDFDALAGASEYYYTADGNYDRVGYSMAIGDLDADGASELIVGAPYYDATSPSGSGRGGIAVFEGPRLLAAGTEIDRGDNFFDGDGASDLLGTYVAVVGDFDGDGVDDLAAGATGVSSGGSNGGAVYLLGGDEARRGDTGDAMLTVTGSSSAYVGRGIGSGIDLDADGMDELVVFYANGSYNAVGVEYGNNSPSDKSVTSLDAQWTTDGTESAFYRNAPVGGDLDGDGYEDLLVSDGMADYSTTDSGAAWVIWGRSSEYAVPSISDIESTATTIIRGTSSSANYAWSTQLGDDWDGDGDAELWVYNQGVGLYVVEGGTSRRSSFEPASVASLTYTWDSSDPDAEMIRNAGDWDGDSIGDMFVFYEDASGSYGRVEVFSSSLRGTYAAVDAIIGNLTGTTDETEGDNANVGYGLPPRGGDIDADGDIDMAAGDAEFNSNEGRAYVLLNGLDPAG